MLMHNSLQEILLLVPVLLISLTVHEMAHGLAAYALGDNTAKREGRLSLNPIHHIDWIGFILLMTVGFGWAKPVPVDPRYFKDPKKSMALTSLAGPFANILLAFLGAAVLSFTTDRVRLLSEALALFVQYNCALAMFNLLPIPPLDGSKIVGAFLPDRLYYRYLFYERYGMIILIILLYTGILTPLLRNGVNNLIGLIIKALALLGL